MPAGSQTSRSMSEPIKGDPRVHSIYLTRGGTIRGRILGTRVRRVSSDPYLSPATTGNQYASGVVDDNGEYRVRNVGFNEGTVEARSSIPWTIASSETFTLDTEGGETWVDLEFPREGSVLAGTLYFWMESPGRGCRSLARGGSESGGADHLGQFEGRFEDPRIE